MPLSRRQIYRRRRLTVFGGIALVLAVGFYLPTTLLAPLPAESATVLPYTAPETTAATVTMPSYCASAIGAVGFDGILAAGGSTDALPMASISTVITADTPGFVVNRILAKLLGEAMHAVEQGTPFEAVVEAVKPFGLPMDPFVLLDLVGLKVGAHVLDTHHSAFPERFFESAALHELAEANVLLEKDGKGKPTGKIDKKAIAIVAKHRPADASPSTADELRRRVEDGLADEIKRMLDGDVVHAAEDIDLCLLLGAGYPFQMGGATPYLDRVGASERTFGGTFHNPPIKGVA